MYGTRQLATEIVDKLQVDLRTRDVNLPGIRSVFLYGSFVRGDWLDSNSDLDIGVLFAGENALPDGFDQLRTFTDEILHGRPFPSHTPGGIDWCTLSAVPTQNHEVRTVTGFSALNIFLFDFVRNSLILWGEDFRKTLPAPPEPKTLVDAWFEGALARIDQLGDSERGRLKAPLIAGHSIFVVQLVFGERTIEKTRMLELYLHNVPDFPMKAAGEHLIRQWVGAIYPSQPPVLEPPSHYRRLVESFWDLVRFRNGNQ